ncbi:MAG TPA: hypothetical protein VHO70_06525 [Chitinispirillaceae bacterium]|nr:hypothetical protein [Chitinispirillaceae bacterium]
MCKLLLFSKSQNSCEGGSLVAVLVIAVITMMFLQSLTFSTRSALKSSARHVSKVSVLNIAEAGKERVIARIRDRTLNFSANQNITVYSNEPFGAGHYTVRCVTTSALDTVKIYSVGSQGADTSRLEVVAYIQPDVNPKGWIQAAYTSRINVSTLGNIAVDGRDYDSVGMYGTLLGTGGVYGVAAGGSVIAGGSSTIGGTTTAPQGTIIPNVTVKEFIDTNGYPQTPGELLGIPQDTLEAHRCTTCPPSDFYGLVYSETPCVFAGGILIVHNSSGTASLDNYHGHFKGLVIADQVKHFNGGASVLGAVFMLGKTSGGNCDGNGGSRIRYSSRIIDKVLNSLLPSNGRRTVTIVSWREVN